MKTSGIEPTTLRLVAQCLHCHRMPQYNALYSVKLHDMLPHVCCLWTKVFMKLYILFTTMAYLHADNGILVFCLLHNCILVCSCDMNAVRLRTQTCNPNM